MLQNVLQDSLAIKFRYRYVSNSKGKYKLLLKLTRCRGWKALSTHHRQPWQSQRTRKNWSQRETIERSVNMCYNSTIQEVLPLFCTSSRSLSLMLCSPQHPLTTNPMSSWSQGYVCVYMPVWAGFPSIFRKLMNTL